jgi:hypothetical protein
MPATRLREQLIAELLERVLPRRFLQLIARCAVRELYHDERLRNQRRE